MKKISRGSNQQAQSSSLCPWLKIVGRHILSPSICLVLNFFLQWLIFIGWIPSQLILCLISISWVGYWHLDRTTWRHGPTWRWIQPKKIHHWAQQKSLWIEASLSQLVWNAQTVAGSSRSCYIKHWSVYSPQGLNDSYCSCQWLNHHCQLIC